MKQQREPGQRRRRRWRRRRQRAGGGRGRSARDDPARLWNLWRPASSQSVSSSWLPTIVIAATTILLTHQNHLIYVESGPRRVADKLDNNNRREQTLHRALPPGQRDSSLGHFLGFLLISSTGTMVEVSSYGDVDPDEEGEGDDAHDDAVDGEHVEGVVWVPSEVCCFCICRPGQGCWNVEHCWGDQLFRWEMIVNIQDFSETETQIEEVPIKYVTHFGGWWSWTQRTWGSCRMWRKPKQAGCNQARRPGIR